MATLKIVSQRSGTQLQASHSRLFLCSAAYTVIHWVRVGRTLAQTVSPVIPALPWLGATAGPDRRARMTCSETGMKELSGGERYGIKALRSRPMVPASVSEALGLPPGASTFVGSPIQPLLTSPDRLSVICR